MGTCLNGQLLDEVDVLAGSEPQLGEIQGSLCHEALDVPGADSAQELAMIINDGEAADVLLLHQGKCLHHVVVAGEGHHLVLALLPVGIPGICVEKEREIRRGRAKDRRGRKDRPAMDEFMLGPRFFW